MAINNVVKPLWVSRNGRKVFLALSLLAFEAIAIRNLHLLSVVKSKVQKRNLAISAFPFCFYGKQFCSGLGKSPNYRLGKYSIQCCEHFLVILSPQLYLWLLQYST